MKILNGQNKVIPPAYEGINNKTSTHINCLDSAHADFLFFKAVKRLLNVNKWKVYSGKFFSDFTLTDRNGIKTDGLANEGLHIRIDIPGPGSKTGMGYDWVAIEKIEHYENNNEKYLFAMKVRPSGSPNTYSGKTAHFLHSNATSTFLLFRNKTKITCSVLGRNERPNTDPETFFDTLRNFFTALAAFAGFSKLQWKFLTRGILHFSGKQENG